jgi:hypothetical protein
MVSLSAVEILQVSDRFCVLQTPSYGRVSSSLEDCFNVDVFAAWASKGLGVG